MTFGGAVIILALPALTYQADGVIAQMVFKHAMQKAVEARSSLSPDQRDRPVFIFADEAHYFLSSYDDTFLSTCRSSRAMRRVSVAIAYPRITQKVGKEKTDAVQGLLGKFGNQVFFSNICNQTNKYASDMVGRGCTQWRLEPVQEQRRLEQKHGDE